MLILLLAAAAMWCIALSYFDIRERRLPNVLTIPGGVGFVTAGAAYGQARPALVGSVLLAVVYGTVYVAVPRALGAGDVKAAFGLGAIGGTFGAHAWVLAAVGGPILTAVAGVAWFRRRGTSTIPHGPGMCLATMLAVAAYA